MQHLQPVINHVSRFFYNRAVGLLVIRVVLGSVFLSHGLTKVGDMATTILAFDALGLSPIIAVLIAWVEIIGGVSLILGIAPRIWATLLGLEMLVAALMIGLVEGIEAVQFEILLAATAFGIVLIGSGKYALYKMECNKCNGLFCIKKNQVCVMIS